MGAAPVVAPRKPQGAPQPSPTAAKAEPDDEKRPTAFERESIAVDRAANGIGERANAIADAQRVYGFLQLILGVFGVGFTGIAAFFAWRATHWAKEAASHTKRSADADNAALDEARKAAADARGDAVTQGERFDKQMEKTQEMVEFTAKSAYAMDHSATATRRMARAMKESAEAAIRAVEATGVQLELSRKAFVADQRPWVGVVGITLRQLEIDREKGAVLKVTLRLKNTGRTPAHQLCIKGRLVPEERPTDTVEDLKIRFNQRPRTPDPKEAVACVFPQQEYESEFDIAVPPDAIFAIPITSGERRFILTLSGFVVYDSQVSGVTDIHASSFIYRVFMKPEAHITMQAWDTVAEVPGTAMRANPWPHGWMAD